MKNQYYGDINDYRKYGLLRIIRRCSQASLFINWMLTPDDSRPDGRFIEYLSAPDRWRHHDPELFDVLKSHIGGGSRDVSLIEQSGILSAQGFHSEITPDDRQERAEWFKRFFNRARGCDLVFFDPDNGLEVRSVPYGRKNSSKYLYWRELDATWAAGSSVLFYQHFTRVERSLFLQTMIDQVGRRTPGSNVSVFQTSHTMFLLATQPDHRSLLPIHHIVESIRTDWGGEFRSS